VLEEFRRENDIERREVGGGEGDGEGAVTRVREGRGQDCRRRRRDGIVLFDVCMR